jgi:C1A family cysteine protease
MTEPLDLEALRDDLTQADATWQMTDENPIVQQTEEYRRTLLGFTPPPDEMSLEEAVADDAAAPAITIAMAETESNIGAPARFDHRDVNGRDYTTAIKDQGGCGSCVAFATVAVIETTYQRAQRNPNTGINLSEAHLFYCHAAEEGRSCSNGWWPDNAFKKIKAKGIATDDKYPYTGAQQACQVQSGWQDSRANVSGHTKTSTRAKMKKWISERGSLTGCFIVYQDFFAYKSGVYRHRKGKEAGGHCVEIIGYDDSLAAWICKNSWGSDWGDNGYFKIGYGQCKIESWAGPYGCNGVSLRDWIDNTRVTGVWSNSSANNAHVFLSGVGWRRLQHNATTTHHAMLNELLGAKAGNRKVNALVDGSTIHELYVI